MSKKVTQEVIRENNVDKTVRDIQETPEWKASVRQFADLQQKYKNAGKKLEDYVLVGDMTLRQAMKTMGLDTKDDKKVQKAGALMVAFCNGNRLPVNIVNPDPAHISFKDIKPEKSVKNINGAQVYQAGHFEKVPTEQLTRLNWWDKLCNLFGITTERMRQYKLEKAAKFQNKMIGNLILAPYKKQFSEIAKEGKELSDKATDNKKSLEEMFFPDGEVPEPYVFKNGQQVSAMAMATALAMNKMTPKQREDFENFTAWELELGGANGLMNILAESGEECKQLMERKKNSAKLDHLDGFLFEEKKKGLSREDRLDQEVQKKLLNQDIEFRPCRYMEEKYKSSDLAGCRKYLPEVAVLLSVKEELQNLAGQNQTLYGNKRLRTYPGEEIMKGLMNQTALEKQIASKAEKGDILNVVKLTRKNLENRAYIEKVQSLEKDETLKNEGVNYGDVYKKIHEEIEERAKKGDLNEMESKLCEEPKDMLMVNQKISKDAEIGGIGKDTVVKEAEPEMAAL